MPPPEPPGLFVERRGTNCMIRVDGDRDSTAYSLFSTIPSLPGHTVVLASVGAMTSRDLPQAAWQAARYALGDTPPAKGHRMWLALSGLGKPVTSLQPWPQRLADELGIEVLAPEGALSLVPGGVLFVEGAWRSFRPEDVSRPWGARHPQPDWEALLPTDPVTAGGLDVETIPAGFLVHAEGTRQTLPAEHVFAVAVDPAHPRLVLGRPGDPGYSPAQAAELIGRFSPMVASTLELVPHTPRVATADWLTELATRLGHDVRTATGMPLYGLNGRIHVIAHNIEGGQLLRHAPTSRCHRPDGSVQVLTAAPPPSGWISAGETVYRLPGLAGLTPGDPVAEVVPAGLSLVPAAVVGTAHAAKSVAPQPHRFIVTVGLPGSPMPGWAPETLTALLLGLRPDALARLKIQVLAELEEVEVKAIGAAAGEHIGTLEFSPEPYAKILVAQAPEAAPEILSPRHRSTTAEQSEFQRFAGDAYQTAVRGLGADLVAVSFYLGGGENGAVALNEALRAGKTPAPDAYLACLTSGLRNLPPFRGVVYRPMRPLGESYSDGEVLTEPGFLSATADETAALPGTSTDVLIWSRSGRATDEVPGGGLPQEIVFPARTRLRVLAVHNGSVLLRELHPDETPLSPKLDSIDLAVLSKLRRELERRRGAAVNVLADQDQIARLESPLKRDKSVRNTVLAPLPLPAPAVPPLTTWSMPVQDALPLPDVFTAQNAAG